MSPENRARTLHGLRIAGAGVTLVASLALLARGVLLTDTFHLEHVDVRGAEMVDEAEVRGVLADWKGRHVLALDLDAMAHDVLSIGWVRDVTIETDLPDRVRVTLFEYQPSLVVKQGRDLWYVDDAGHAFAAVSPERLRDLPILTVPNDREEGFAGIVPDALGLLDRLEGSPYAERLSAVHYDADLGYSLEFGSVEVYVGWEVDSVGPERVRAALAWLPEGARVPAAVISVAGTDDLVVRLFGGIPEEVRVTAK